MRAGTHDASEGTPDKMCCGSIIQRKSLRHFPARHEAVESGPSFWFAVEMRTTGSRKQSKTRQTRQTHCGRIRHARSEPANGAGADSRQHNSHAPGSSEQSRKIPLTPDCQHAFRVSAANVDDVLRQQHLFQVWGSTKQRDMRRPTPARLERRVELLDVAIGVATCRCEKTHGRRPRPCLRQDVRVERRVVRLHREAAPTHREDLSLVHVAGCHPPRSRGGCAFM